MEERISHIRIDIIVNEYLRQISRYKDKYSGLSHFPYLNNAEFLKAYKSKKLEVRSHYRMLAIAILSEYISVGLNNNLSEKVYSIANHDIDYPEKLMTHDPLIFLLIKLHLNNEEIDSESHDNINHFESFMILDREFRIGNKFNELLYLIVETGANPFKSFITQARDNTNNSGFWEAPYNFYKGSKEVTKNKDVFLKTIDLINFINEISELIKVVKSDFLGSGFWFYYKHFFKAIRLISSQLEQFLKVLKQFEPFLESQDEFSFSAKETVQVKGEISNEIDDSINNIIELSV